MNADHPAYIHFVTVLDDSVDDLGADELARRLVKADFVLKMLLFAWARYEDKAPIGEKDRLSDFRMDWGREARKFLEAVEL